MLSFVINSIDAAKFASVSRSSASARSGTGLSTGFFGGEARDVDGIVAPEGVFIVARREAPSRNGPCPSGSGLPYNSCHGGLANRPAE
jgi:hypothetical protein